MRPSGQCTPAGHAVTSRTLASTIGAISAARWRATVSATTVPKLVTVRTARGDRADVGGAPKGCARSLPTAICASAAARRRRSCAWTSRVIARRARVRADGTPLRSRIEPRVGAERARRRRFRSRVRHRAQRGREPRRARRPKGPGRVAARSACATSARHRRARARAPPGRRLRGRRASAARCVGARDEARSLEPVTRDRSPADHRRQPDDELRDRRRVSRRPGRVAEPEQVALDPVGAGLQPIVAGRRAAARNARSGEQRADDQAAGLGRQRLASRAVPATFGSRVQRHRQRQKRAARSSCARKRTLAAQLEETWLSVQPVTARRGRRRSIRRTARVRSRAYVGSGAERVRAGVAGDGHRTRPGGYPVFFVPRPVAAAGRESAPAAGSTHPQIGSSLLPHLLPTHPKVPGSDADRVRSASPPRTTKAAAQAPNSRSCATAVSSGDGGN